MDLADSARIIAMIRNDSATRALLDALDDPALIVERGIVRVASASARSILGDGIEGSDVRLAIRQPQALDFVLSGIAGDMDFTGVGSVGRPWRLALRPLGDGGSLVRLIDRSPAVAAEKFRVDFVANASHELRTPLTAVLGYAESLEDADLDPKLASKFASTIRTEAGRMLRIIEDLMSLSRIEADRFVAPSDRVSIQSVARSAAERFRQPVEARGCALEVAIDDDLPLLSGDPPQLAQLVDNLLSNAVRYGCTEAGGTVRISASLNQRSVSLEVSDTGAGIPRKHLPFVTRRFYRVDEARSRDTGGTGLGLAIVKHIVERHRATLSIDSGDGQGTTVTILFPLP